jgi:proline dehydrogenase
MSWLNKVIATTLPAVPKPIVRRVSARYIAGETLADAVRQVRSLNQEGMRATLDVLGEFVRVEEEARRAGAAYEEVLREIGGQGLDSNVSVKLTQLGLKLPGTVCLDIAESIVTAAGSLGNFVRIDMEDSSCTDATLEVFRELKRRHPERVGCVIQAYLKRSEDDVRALVKLGANVRLCKGIYIESPEIAYRDPLEINRNFVRLLTLLLGGGAYTAIATHDERLVDSALSLVEKFRLPSDRYEFQMLLGVRPELRKSIVTRGHRLRVYVPFGSHWYAYSLRRLKENPQIAGHVMKAFLNGRA